MLSIRLKIYSRVWPSILSLKDPFLSLLLWFLFANMRWLTFCSYRAQVFLNCFMLGRYVCWYEMAFTLYKYSSALNWVLCTCTKFAMKVGLEVDGNSFVGCIQSESKYSDSDFRWKLWAVLLLKTNLRSPHRNQSKVSKKPTVVAVFLFCFNFWLVDQEHGSYMSVSAFGIGYHEARGSRSFRWLAVPANAMFFFCFVFLCVCDRHYRMWELTRKRKVNFRMACLGPHT